LNHGFHWPIRRNGGVDTRGVEIATGENTCDPAHVLERVRTCRSLVPRGDWVTEIVTCPADGCDYEGLPSSVLAHYSGKRDPPHEGGYNRARTLLDADGSNKEPEPEPEPATADGGELSFPANPEPPAEPEPEPAAEPECPGCGATGGEVVETSETIDVLGDRLKERHVRALRRHDLHCTACGEVFDR